jgi:hypothetical protein
MSEGAGRRLSPGAPYGSLAPGKVLQGAHWSARMSITLIVALISGFCLSASLLLALGLGVAAARGDEQLAAPRRPAGDEAKPPARPPARPRR